MEMRVYYADTTPLKDGELFRRAYSVLPTERKQKAHRLRTEESKRQCVGAGVLLRRLSEDSGLPGEDNAIGISGYGKPYYLNRPDHYFNLSHSGDYVLGVISSVETGCDIQKGIFCQESLALRICTDSELAFLHSLPENQRNFALTDIWCRKESVLKAVGTGFALSPRHITLSPAAGLFPPWQNSGLAVLRDGDRVEHFSLIAPVSIPGYALSVALPVADDCSVIVRRISFSDIL